MHEKMAIYSLISLTVFAVILVSFGGGRRRGREPSGGGGGWTTLRNLPAVGAGAYRLSGVCLGLPLFIPQDRLSPGRRVLEIVGRLVQRPGPTATAAGTWDLTPDGKLRITPRSAGTPHMYTRISGHGSAVLMRPDLGLVEAWYMGPGALACIQISIFGNSASVPATMRFSTAWSAAKPFTAPPTPAWW
jgi:hypothetical protein